MINTWNESLLHEELKEYYRGEAGESEISLEGSICDVLHEDGSITEIQTSSISKLRAKLEKLLEGHKVRVVYPVATSTLIETYSKESELVSRRKSPKKGNAFQIFSELTGITHLIGHPNLTITVQLAEILELRIADGTGSWRRKGVRISDRKLIRLNDALDLATPADYLSLIPPTVPSEFTVADLRDAGAGRHAGKMAWVLRTAGLVEMVEKRGRAFVYRKKKGCRKKKIQATRGKKMDTTVPTPSLESTVTSP